MDTSRHATPWGRRLALAVAAVLLGLAALSPAAPAAPGDRSASPAPAAGAGASELVGSGHHVLIDLDHARVAPPVRPGTRAADPRAYVKPGWLPLRGQQRLGCVTTNCNGSGHDHWAIDISLPRNAPVYATGSGRVHVTVTDQGGNCNQAVYPSTFQCPNGARGNAVVIHHGDGVYSFYGHLNRVAVRPGQMVTDGTIIASAGTSGWTAPTFNHLHYEEWQGFVQPGGTGVRTQPRALKACHGGVTVTYPSVGGAPSWNGLPGFGVWLRHDGVCNPNGPTCISGFYDVSGTSGFCGAVTWMVDADITAGYADNLFHPTRTVTRQTTVAWLHRLAGAPAGPFPDPGLVDVPTDHPFRTAIAWAVQAGVVTGYPDDSFRGTAPVTRAAFMALLHRLAGAPGGPFPDPGLSDVHPGVPFYHEVSWAVAAGVANGYGDGTFRRGRAVARQEGAAFLWRFDEPG